MPKTLTRVQNPILRGFNPDPSILRVEDDYYIATSTFEWFPGVQIHHSKDLVSWNLITRPLARLSQLNMLGNPDSGGIWAPCLSYSDGVFYLVYTDVKAWKEDPYKVAHNYLVTADNIMGPWSDPVYLNSSGFDPSLFHDEDGRKWFVNMVWDHRKNHERFANISLQEYDPSARKLVGPRKSIFNGTPIGSVEGPHLYKANGYYYLLTAEGGTEYEHASSIARSRNIDGTYEIHPSNPLISSSGDETLALQKAGHGSLVESHNGEWYFAHLCGRPIDGKHCILGRETALQPIEWKNDWPYVKGGGNQPLLTWDIPTESEAEDSEGSNSSNIDFASVSELPLDFQSLRRPITSAWLSQSDRPGWLRLYGQECTTSLFKQSLIARRLQAFNADVELQMEFEPEDFQQMAGLILYYDTRNHYYLRVSCDEALGKCINVIRTERGVSEELYSELSISEDTSISLKAEIRKDQIQFCYSIQNDWNSIGTKLPGKILSDDYDHLGFTGAFVGMCVQDITGQKKHADFKYFNYSEINP